MKLSMKLLAGVFLLLTLFSLAPAQMWEYPVIKDYGQISPLPDAAVQPDKNLEYKIVFGISQAAKDYSGVNPGLERIAQLINVFASAGVTPDKMKLVAVIYGPATPIALTNKNYHAQFDNDNPNLQLISQLKKSGVQIYVCGQSLFRASIELGWVNPDVSIALSSLVAIPTYELKGYALMPW